MKDKVDLLILINCPAFYKINLYNEIAKTRKIFVVFIGYFDQVVIDSNFRDKIQFPYTVLNEMQLSKRSLLFSFLALRKVMKKLDYKLVLYGGYVDPEFVFTSFIVPRKKNVLQTESAGETKLAGIRFYIKRMILKRYSKAVASGSIHSLMLKKMGYSNEILISKGVGLINKSKQEYLAKENGAPLNFLYVGRLIELKNLKTLIDVFNTNGLSLTIVGTGEMEAELKGLAGPNITFKGFVANEDLGPLYSCHQVFVLPSLSEAWGLVVEEALYRGCVLALSERVGCSEDLLTAPNTGATFDPENPTSLLQAIEDIRINYVMYKKNVDLFSIDKKDQHQVAVYATHIFDK